jgi:pimeloyl-ACP methyl ester carboxylesterase
MNNRIGRSQNRIRGFDSEEIEYQQLRPLGASQYGGASVGEIMYATNGVSDADPQTWVGRFEALADHTAVLAAEALAKGHQVSARDHSLRASTYYRSAEYYADPERHSRVIGTKSRQAFVSALPFMPHHAEVVAIPHHGSTFPGYFMRPLRSDGDGRTVVMLSGSDGTSEEIYFFMGRGAIERGYNVLLIDGPGQVGAFRLDPGSCFRPDYELPLGDAISFVTQTNGVDADRLALFGVSFGGYFVARTAAMDPRVKAVIADSPLCDVGPIVGAILGDLAPYAKPTLKSHIIRFGATSAATFLAKANEYVLGADLLSNITCPSLALSSAGEGEAFRAQCEFYARSVRGPVTERQFGAEYGADAHCQMGNAQMLCAVAFDWLDEIFSP